MSGQLTTRQRNKIDRAVSEIARRRCSGMAIDVMKIKDVFQAAYDAAATGADIERAVVSKYSELAGVPNPDTFQTDEHCQYCGNSWQQTRTIGTPRLDSVPCPKCRRLV